MGGTRRSLAAFVFIGYRLMIGFSEISSQSSSLPVCEIPEGKFDGMFYDSYFNESLYGDRCPAEVSFHMVRIYRCLFKYCCSSPCHCSTALLSNTCPNNATVIPCFEVKTEPEYFRYNCCSGSVEDRFHVCTKQIDCKRRADSGCDVGQVCLRNETSGFDFCDCPPGFNITVVNSNGTKVCKDINECASNDSSSCSDVCVNSNGSYSCACDRNRTLDPDGHHCSGQLKCTRPFRFKTRARGRMTSHTLFRFAFRDTLYTESQMISPKALYSLPRSVVSSASVFVLWLIFQL